MDSLPDELIYHVLEYLNVIDIVRLQQASRRYSSLARNKSIWRLRCFDDSRVEASRRRQQLIGVHDARLASLRSLVSRFPHAVSLNQNLDAVQRGIEMVRSTVPDPETIIRTRSLANWDPAYPSEKMDYYEEYVQRHAAISLSWIDLHAISGLQSPSDITGIALARLGDHHIPHALCSLDDGSVLIYDSCAASPSDAILGHSGPGLLTPGARSRDESYRIMTAAGAVEGVSINTDTCRGYLATSDMLHEVDLNTLSSISVARYSSMVTALSSYTAERPLVVGTNDTVQIYDARQHNEKANNDDSVRTELFVRPTSLHHRDRVRLSQPGPLAITHTPCDTDSIWIAGRFTSLLQYSLRSFPQLLSTFHSGARISSMTTLPYPYIPRSLDLTRNPTIPISARAEAKQSPGWTAICAGQYKGKGSLELYSMSAEDGSYTGAQYVNRQTAGASKLLSVAAHGGKIVHSDGDGNLRWFERDGVSFVRTFRIKDSPAPISGVDNGSDVDAAAQGIWSTDTSASSQGDIVQKIIPFRARSDHSKYEAENLMLWTGDGKLAVLGFGPNDPLHAEIFHDAIQQQAESASDKAKRDAERQFGMAMRRALERNADEVRFMRGLGMSEPIS